MPYHNNTGTLSHHHPTQLRPLRTPIHHSRYRQCLYPLHSAQCGVQSHPTPATADGTAVAAVQPFDALSQWLTENGGSVGSITVGDCQMGDATVRGLVATQDLPVNTPVISVPVQR